MQDYILPPEIQRAIKERDRAAATLNPDLCSVLEEVQGKFRLLDTTIKERISPFINAVEHLAAPLATIPHLPPLVVPQIKLPAFPDFLRDFIAAQKGDKEAVTRLSKMIPATKKAQREVLTDAILDVLCHTEEALPLFLCSDLRLDPWHDEDGNLKSLTPDNWLLKEVWEWFTVETVNAANSRLRGDPYVPKVRLSQEPNEEEPFPLWLPSDPGQLIIKGQAGAPPGPRGLPVEPEFLKSVKEAIEAVQEQKKKLTAQNVALFWLDQQGRSKNYERPARQLISAARFFKPDTRWKELKERAIQI